jgi:glycosyltransferase involved in cell wall biosynthesis
MATRNRAGILERVLDSYTRLTEPPEDWQLVVVDNGSADSTPEVVQHFAGRLPVTYVLEPQVGKARAVNAGLQRVAGDLTLFTDDDIQGLLLPPAGFIGRLGIIPSWRELCRADPRASPDWRIQPGVGTRARLLRDVR